jgi:transglutaminase-like putative cysteine protease
MRVFRRLAAKRFLFGGKTTRKTPQIREIAASLRGKTKIETVQNILRYIGQLSVGGETPARERTADQSLKEKHVRGCSNAAAVFASLARANGIPSRLVDTVAEGYQNQPHFEGHVFVDAFINGKWIAINPMHGKVLGQGYYIKKHSGKTDWYIPFSIGKDFSTMGVMTIEQIRKRAAKQIRRQQKKKR